MESNRRVLIIGADGLRPDNVSRDITPTCWRLAQEGTLFSSFHSAYPSATRVCTSTLTTGTYPGRHGVFANRMRVAGFPLDEQWVQTGNDRHIRTFNESMNEPFLLQPTLGDRMQRNGKTLAVAASSSPGASFIWNMNVPGNVVNPSSDCEKPELAHKARKLGLPRKEDLSGNRDKVEWATKALIELLLPDPDYDCMVLWLNEPDTANHGHGLGSPQAIEALRLVDACVAEVLSAIDRLGLNDRLDLMLISDHGHSSVQKQKPLSEWLQQYESERGLSERWLTSDYYLYYQGEDVPDTAELQHLTDWLYAQDWCGLVFAHPDYANSLSGVISMEA
ncbi:MAG: Type phosphodiesterase / nucleotide pyrophosphatase superfamily protein, partial [Paenibacillaceae bacterium]|nr:Type phosphodiesterase / nucleotide pyrophosphatase superfamily protein [Paenibacillaceae bacterium]